MGYSVVALGLYLTRSTLRIQNSQFLVYVYLWICGVSKVTSFRSNASNFLYSGVRLNGHVRALSFPESVCCGQREVSFILMWKKGW